MTAALPTAEPAELPRAAPRGGAPARPDVLFALVGDVRGSSRALRQLRALRDAGLSAEVLTLGPPLGDALGEGLPLDGRLRARVLPTPPGRGPRFFWAAHRAFRAAALARPAGLYLASDLYTLPGLAEAARHHGARLAFDSRELYAALDSSAGRPWVRGVWRAVERRAIRRADAVFTVNRAIAERLSRAYGIPPPVVLHNAPARQPVPATDRLRRAAGIGDGPPIVLYQGGLRPGRGLPALVDAVAAVPEAALVVIGDGPMEAALRRQAAPLGDRVRFLGFVGPDELPALTAGADLGTLLIEPLTESLRLALPNKLFEYLMAGVPVLAGPGPEVRRVVERYDVGLVADPADPGAVAAALRRALTDETARTRWRANAPRALDAHAWEHDAARFQQTLLDLLNR
ncbi:MAG: glycosyltransferase family 4 protein [Rubricoccaceae bacterium]|nr:glycosyltransferase family 4 protein [Rubricoccaceae bacterium]